ncbi:MAG: hypothetical protein AB2598_13250 [Candidatus Thiodiazotropha sp.]
MKNVICPYCEQGIIWRVLLDNSDSEEYCMCLECDTIWKPNEAVTYGTGMNFELFMERKGDSADWSIIKRINPLER